MWDLAVREQDFAAIDGMLGRYRGQPPLSLRLVPAYARNATATVPALLEEGRNLESRQLQIAGRYLATYLEDFVMADSLARLDLLWRDRAANRAGAQLLVAGLAAAGGRWAAARDGYRIAEGMEGGGDAVVHRAMAALLPLQPVPPTDLATTRDELERWEPPTGGSGGMAAALQPHLRLYLLGLLSSRLGDGAAADRLADSVERLPVPLGGEAVVRGMAATIRADVAHGREQAAGVLRALERVDDRIPLELIALSRAAHLREFGLEHSRYLRAVALSRLGRDNEALAWFRFGLRGSPQEYQYLAPLHLGMGEVFERLGQRDSAAVHYDRFLRLWREADPAAGTLVGEVRQRLARVSSAAHP